MRGFIIHVFCIECIALLNRIWEGVILTGMFILPATALPTSPPPEARMARGAVRVRDWPHCPHDGRLLAAPLPRPHQLLDTAEMAEPRSDFLFTGETLRPKPKLQVDINRLLSSKCSQVKFI